MDNFKRTREAPACIQNEVLKTLSAATPSGWIVGKYYSTFSTSTVLVVVVCIGLFVYWKLTAKPPDSPTEATDLSINCTASAGFLAVPCCLLTSPGSNSHGTLGKEAVGFFATSQQYLTFVRRPMRTPTVCERTHLLVLKDSGHEGMLFLLAELLIAHQSLRSGIQINQQSRDVYGENNVSTAGETMIRKRAFHDCRTRVHDSISVPKSKFNSQLVYGKPTDRADRGGGKQTVASKRARPKTLSSASLVDLI
uniref:Uncharacterized protein n=1 Tax=Anopheles farauti TaxID=69004 RepID=A0A182QL62_9DIPT